MKVNRSCSQTIPVKVNTNYVGQIEELKVLILALQSRVEGLERRINAGLYLK